MAKGGPVISAGPAIASGRGGFPLGVRVGGIEGGRSVLISPAEARITNIFGPAIKSHNIGFGVPNPRGERSVIALSPLKNPFPERGESGNTKAEGAIPGRDSGQPNVVLATIRYTEPVPVRKLTTNLVFKTAERPDAQRFAEQHVFAKRVRATLTRLTIPGVRTGVIRIETSAAVKTQVQPQVGTALETASKTAVSTAPKPEVKAGRQIPNKVRTQVGNFEQGINSRREQYLTRRYIGQDLERNSLRLKALTSKFEQLNGSTSQDVVDGAVLAGMSEIGTARLLRSKLLDQRGYTGREDGSQKEIEARLNLIQDVSKGDLERLVEANSAVEATDKPPLKLATPEEVIKVLTPPNSPVTIEPVIVEEVTEKLVVTREAVKASVLAAQPMQVSGEPKINDIEKIEAVRDNIVIFPSRLLDMEEYINSNEENGVFKRRQLVLAA